MSEQSHSLIGRVLADKLRLDSLLGEGAAGAVYRAHHMALDKAVAIKVLHQTHASDPQLIRRFKAEARAASRLDHPNSVRILDFGEDGPDKLLYIAMEFLDGESLQELLEREPQLASWRIASIMAQVAAGLAVAHEQGIVHRDVKPGNIMLLRQMGEEGVEQEIVKVCDFGLAKILDANPDEMTGGPLTKQGTIFGTPTYMSPEQANGHAVDGRADQYACGVIMYRMASGRPPFMADTSTGVLMKHILDAPTPIAELAPHLDARLTEIVNRSLEKEPDDRYASLREVVPILREVAQGAPEGAVPMVRMPSTIARSATPAAPVQPTASADLSDTHQPVMAPMVPAVAPMAPVALAPATLSSVPPPTIQPASNKAPMLAAVMGSVALLAVGGLGTYVLVGPGSRPPAVVAEPLQPDAKAPAMQPSEPAKEEVPEPEVPAKEAPTLPPPTEAKAPAARPRPKAPTKKPKPRPAPKPTPTKPKTPAKAPEPPVVAKPPVEEAKPPVKTPTAPTRTLKPKLKVPTAGLRPTLKPSLQPKGPAKLGASFSFDVSVSDLNVGGGLSKGRTRDALERSLVEVKACLRKLVKSAGLETSGSVRVKGRIVGRGRLRDLKATGGISGASSCATEGLARARMPQPDTGDAVLSLTIRYSAKAQ